MSYDTKYDNVKTNTGATGARGTPDDEADVCSSTVKPVDEVMPQWSGRGRSAVAPCMNLFLARSALRAQWLTRVFGISFFLIQRISKNLSLCLYFTRGVGVSRSRMPASMFKHFVVDEARNLLTS